MLNHENKTDAGEWYCLVSSNLASISGDFLKKATKVRKFGEKLALYAPSEEAAKTLCQELKDAGAEALVEQTSMFNIMM